MKTRVAYQTLENRENPDEVENLGPFKCTRRNAWLGDGYYFWDYFIENAHWWGCEGARYGNGYFICKATYEFDEKKCFNLIDNQEHFYEFNGAKKLMMENGLYQPNVTTVARIIEYVRTTLKVFTYEAIRAHGINSKSFKSEYSNRTLFDVNQNTKYLDSLPALQICFFSKSSLSLSNFKLIFPAEYTEGYLV